MSLGSIYRWNAADYLIPEALAIDQECAPYLIDLARSIDLPATKSEDGSISVMERRLWGVVNVVQQVTGGSKEYSKPMMMHNAVLTSEVI